MELKIPNKLVEFEKHEPERRHAPGGRVLCNGGCCCCSCCVHSLGGLIGAAMASRKDRSPRGGSVMSRYWGTLTLLTLVVFALTSFSGVAQAVIAVLLSLPIIQLVASVIVLVWIKLQKRGAINAQADLRILGRVTLWSFTGALIGLGAMILGLAALAL